MLIAYERLGSAWAASLILLADMAPSMLLGPLVGAWLDRRDRLRCAIAADVLRAAALVAMIVAPGAPRCSRSRSSSASATRSSGPRRSRCCPRR